MRSELCVLVRPDAARQAIPNPCGVSRSRTLSPARGLASSVALSSALARSAHGRPWRSWKIAIAASSCRRASAMARPRRTARHKARRIQPGRSASAQFLEGPARPGTTPEPYRLAPPSRTLLRQEAQAAATTSPRRSPNAATCAVASNTGVRRLHDHAGRILRSAMCGRSASCGRLPSKNAVSDPNFAGRRRLNISNREPNARRGVGTSLHRRTVAAGST